MNRAMARATRGMAMMTKRVMTTDSNNMGNCYGKESDRHLMAATMETTQRTWLLMLQLERVG
jgi:hypothetical protein